MSGMNTSSTSFHRAAAVLAAGGLCWVLKFIVIAASGGALSGAPATMASVLYITAVLLMVLGMAGLGATLLAGRHLALQVLGFIGGVVGWVLSYVVIETIAQSLVGATDPVWVGEEVGIVATGAILMTVGLMLARSRDGGLQRSDVGSAGRRVTR